MVHAPHQQSVRLKSRDSLLPAVLPAAARSAVSATATTAATIFFGPGFVDIQCPAVQIAAVQPGDGALALTVVAHFHESKTARPSRVPVGYDVYTIHCAVLLKQSANGAFGCVKTEISYKNVLHLFFFLEFAEQRTRAGWPELAGLSNYIQSMARYEPRYKR